MKRMNRDDALLLREAARSEARDVITSEMPVLRAARGFGYTPRDGLEPTGGYYDADGVFHGFWRAGQRVGSAPVQPV